MTTQQIYQDFLIPNNLQEHMLRSAALASIIIDHWTGPEIDKKAIIQASFFHDMAKPMTFNLAKQAQFGMLPADIASLEKLQNRLKSKYGNNEHQATVKICKDIGCRPAVVKLVDNLEWGYIPRLLKEGNLESLILIYCDIRIGPGGILTIKERHKELGNRVTITNPEERIRNAEKLEKLITDNVSINVNSINDEQINKRMADFLKLEISQDK